MVLTLLLAFACGSDTESAASDPLAEGAAPPAEEGDPLGVPQMRVFDPDVDYEEVWTPDELELDEDGSGQDGGEVAEAGEEVVLLPPLDELEALDFGSRESIVHEASGAVTGVRVILAANMFIRGVPCREAKTAEAHADGRWSCVLSEPYGVGDFSLRRGARATFHENGNLAEVVLGDLASPAESVTVAGVPCLSAALLHDNGNVASCTLARGNRFPGDVLLPRGTKVDLRSDGGLVRAEVYEDVSIRGTPYAAGTMMFDGVGGVSGHQVGVFGS
ncbi:MAG TPA: hypothetical protein QGF58_24765 [Myxococcota bacterium]|nr:hypothetical protein [Myxococcota bacterium]